MSKTPMQQRADTLLELMDASEQMMHEATNDRPEVALWTEMFTEQLDADRALLQGWSDGSSPEPEFREFVVVARRVLRVLVPALEDASHHVSTVLRLPAGVLGALVWALERPKYFKAVAMVIKIARYVAPLGLVAWLAGRWAR